jgi:predicted SAM-dependent methyltransferase
MRRLPYFTYPIKIDLGCGKNKINNHVGIDREDFGQEVVWDVVHGLPFPNDSVDGFHSSHFFEHIRWEDVSNLLSEIVRVCKDGTFLDIIVPHAETKEAFYLCHYSRWNEQVVEGVVADSPNLELVSLGRREIHFDVRLVVRKPARPKTAESDSRS